MLADNCLEVCPQTIETIDCVWNICRRSFDTRSESIRTTGSDRSLDSRSQRTSSSPRPKRIQTTKNQKRRTRLLVRTAKELKFERAILRHVDDSRLHPAEGQLLAVIVVSKKHHGRESIRSCDSIYSYFVFIDIWRLTSCVLLLSSLWKLRLSSLSPMTPRFLSFLH